ncbi:putative YigZ family protein [Saonia flava]|uniref:Putative YigZ family protein n=1 Tax=Saonia flava TaxID=523696 RepID=A0A846QVE2_9FLAO|nr:YigZ family protein [Saonia flava]NJB70542.1 putative YigZ family protein [Saonia flava]
MENGCDIYKTILKPSEEILYKDKKSKFYGYAFPILSEDEVKPIIEELKKKHPKVNHVCYAWQLGVKSPTYRTNDDGEPNNSAGMPILGQIKSYNVTNILVAIARVFGGTKLGVGGLITAYRSAAQIALEESTIIEKIIKYEFSISFDYPEMDKVMRIIKQHHLEIVSKKTEINCTYTLAVREQEVTFITSLFTTMPNILLNKKT